MNGAMRPKKLSSPDYRRYEALALKALKLRKVYDFEVFWTLRVNSCENRHVDATSCLNTSEFAGIHSKRYFFNFCTTLAPIVFPIGL